MVYGLHSSRHLKARYDSIKPKARGRLFPLPLALLLPLGLTLGLALTLALGFGLFQFRGSRSDVAPEI